MRPEISTILMIDGPVAGCTIPLATTEGLLEE
jgi:hypothetical protein